MINKSADGLRGIAALNVVVCHFVSAFLPSMLHNSYPTLFNKNEAPTLVFDIFTSPIFSIIYNGHFSVLIFFILSGYVLTIPYFSYAENKEKKLEQRLCGRYLRLNIPIIAAILISFLVYKIGFYTNIEASDISGSTIWLKQFYPSGLSFADASKEAFYEAIALGKSKFIPPLWTLKVEFIGSLYVLLFYIIKPKSQNFIPLVFALIFIYFVHKQESIYYYAIFFGSLINITPAKSKLIFPAFLIGLYFGGFQFGTAAYNYLPKIILLDREIWDQKTFYNAIGAFLITASVVHGFASKFFQSKFSQFLGKVSFSVYLLHFVILCSLSSYLYVTMPKDSIYLLLNFSVYISLCFFVAYIFEFLVDKPAIKISHAFSTLILRRFKKI